MRPVGAHAYQAELEAEFRFHLSLRGFNYRHQEVKRARRGRSVSCLTRLKRKRPPRAFDGQSLDGQSRHSSRNLPHAAARRAVTSTTRGREISQ
jgi:hypothetical protein